MVVVEVSEALDTIFSADHMADSNKSKQNYKQELH